MVPRFSFKRGGYLGEFFDKVLTIFYTGFVDVFWILNGDEIVLLGVVCLFVPFRSKSYNLSLLIFLIIENCFVNSLSIQQSNRIESSLATLKNC